MDNCICNDESVVDLYNCFRCQSQFIKAMDPVTRRHQCPVHGHTGLMICGQYENACNDCSEEGWYSTAGFGGPTEHINKITGEKIQIPYEQGEPF